MAINTTDNTSHYQNAYDCAFPTCSDRGMKCASCVHNPRRSYYEPYRPYPSFLYYPQVWWKKC